MKFLNLACLVLFFFCCCHKSSNNTAGKASAFSYSVSADTTINAYANSTASVSVSMSVLSGSISGNTVTVAIAGLPSGVTDSPASIVVGGTLGGIFYFNVGNLAAGSYPLTLTSACAGTPSQTHSLHLNILAQPDYSALLAGVYPNCHDYCQPADSLFAFSSTVSAVSGTPYTITIANVKICDTTVTITATLRDVITIPRQTIGNYIITGTGTYTHDNPPNSILYALSINDTTIHGHDTEACLLHIQH